MATGVDGPHWILTVVGKISSPHSFVSEILSTFAESGDQASGFERHLRRVSAREREKEIAYLKGLVTHAWNWILPVSPSEHPSPGMSMESQLVDSIKPAQDFKQPKNAGPISTCIAGTGNSSGLVHRHRIADSGS